ncbi:hypothetical protein AB4Y32_16180 [Paraburkholderia phymatum]|uniref:Uncharacterized protein n=1 Tax=Paraburkholderia phymatum TaxID=148447 RepID=A0ACC6U104_9BURK
MLRFIIKTKWREGHSGAEGEFFKTIDLDVPELQDALTLGGYSENSYEMAQLIGVETLKDQT